MSRRSSTTTFAMLFALCVLSGCVNGPRGLLGHKKAGHACGGAGCTDPACFAGVDNLAGPLSVSSLMHGGPVVSEPVVSSGPLFPSPGHSQPIAAAAPVVIEAASCGSCGTQGCGGGCQSGPPIIQHAVPAATGPVICGAVSYTHLTLPTKA